MELPYACSFLYQNIGREGLSKSFWQHIQVPWVFQCRHSSVPRSMPFENHHNYQLDFWWFPSKRIFLHPWKKTIIYTLLCTLQDFHRPSFQKHFDQDEEISVKRLPSFFKLYFCSTELWFVAAQERPLDVTFRPN